MIDLALHEWSTVGPVQLEPYDLQSLEDGCAALNMRERLRVVPGFHGVEVSSTSYVGRVTLGPFRISVNPKLRGAPLARLVKYAYSLDELSLFDERTDINIEKDGLQDLLVSLLIGHIEAIWLSGLPQTYRHQADDLSSIRGRVRTEVLWRKGAMTSATVPCLFFERTPNWHLNRVLRSGIDLALKLAGNAALRTRVARVQTWFQNIDPLRVLGPADVEEARRSLTRLTSQIAPALELIAMLVDGAGVGFRSSTDTSALAFMFDMNRFFQRLISRFLHDHLRGCTVADEFLIREMYSFRSPVRKRRLGTPRPDFATLNEHGQLMRYLDAKYRDLWIMPLPPDWLYQLTTYALASPERLSVILYPTMSREACDETVEVSDPITRQRLAQVLLRPVSLDALGELVLAESPTAVASKQKLAARLAAAHAHARFPT